MKRRHLLSLAWAFLSAAGFSVFGKSSDLPVQFRIELDRPVLPANSNEKAIVKIAFEGVRLPRPGTRAPVNLALVLDRSGSMRGDKIERAKEAAIEAVHRLAPDDIFSLVV